MPAGVGNFDLAVRAARDLAATAYIGLPSYLKALLEKAEEQDGPPLRFERAIVTAEPLPPSLRSWLEERVPIVRQMYGTAESGTLGFECEAVSGLHVPDDALVEVCNLDDGSPRLDGGEGQVVVTAVLGPLPAGPLRDGRPLGLRPRRVLLRAARRPAWSAGSGGRARPSRSGACSSIPAR